MMKLSRDSVIDSFIKTHGSYYDYSKFHYINGYEKSVIICPIHGDFLQTPNKHKSGQGCPLCRYEKIRISNRKDKHCFFTKAPIIHKNKYSYTRFKYIDVRTKGIITCPIHGDFLQDPYNHIKGRGCPKCSATIKADNTRKTTKEFIERATLIHKGKYDYSKTNYINAREKVTIVCPIHGDFKQIPYDHLSGKGCKKCCSASISKPEMEIQNFIGKHLRLVTVHFNDRDALGCKLELDVYFPDLKLAIEYNGEYYHSSNEVKERDKRKQELCKSLGIKLIIIHHEKDYKKDKFKVLMNIYKTVKDYATNRKTATCNELSNR